MNCKTSQILIANQNGPEPSDLCDHIKSCEACHAFRATVTDLDHRLRRWRNETMPISLRARSTERKPSPTGWMLPLGLAGAIVVGVGLGIRARAPIPAKDLKASLAVKEPVKTLHLFQYQLDGKSGKLTMGQWWEVKDQVRLEKPPFLRALHTTSGDWDYNLQTRQLTATKNRTPKKVKVDPDMWLAQYRLFPDETNWSPDEKKRAPSVPRDTSKIVESTDQIGTTRCRRFDYVDRLGARDILWVDAATNRTVRFAFLQDDGKSRFIEFDFRWDEAISTKVFDPDRLKYPLTTLADPYPVDANEFSPGQPTAFTPSASAIPAKGVHQGEHEQRSGTGG